MKRAACLIREEARYFRAGLEAAGYRVFKEPLADPRQHDLLLCWNRRPCDEAYIRQFERAGAKVIIAENGFLGHDDEGNKLIALALGHHCGAGSWHIGPAERWKQQNIALKPWRTGGEDIIVMLQRGIGEPGISMPPEWPVQITPKLRSVTGRRVVLQKHPGKVPLAEALAINERDIENAWAVVGWSSARPLHAIACGVPAFYEFPRWIGAPLARQGVSQIESPWRGDREAGLQAIGWAQWSRAEIATGMPFHYLLGAKT